MVPSVLLNLVEKSFLVLFLLSLSRYKLKFSPDKVDTMVVQAICKLLTALRDFCLCMYIYTTVFFPALLDDLDKELNNYNMRCREWYGWHFPELGKIVTDNFAYVRTVKAIGEYVPAVAFHL